MWERGINNMYIGVTNDSSKHLRLGLCGSILTKNIGILAFHILFVIVTFDLHSLTTHYNSSDNYFIMFEVDLEGLTRKSLYTKLINQGTIQVYFNMFC